MIQQPELQRMLRRQPRHMTALDVAIFLFAGFAVAFAVAVLTLTCATL